MKRNLAVVLTAVLAIAATMLVPSPAQSAPAPAAFSHNVCGPPAHGTARCHAKVVDLDAGAKGKPPTPKATTSPQGLSIQQIRAAYGFTNDQTAGLGETIAIVDAYDDPTAENDLGVFSTAMGLPACTTQNLCFKKVNQAGGSSYPASNSGWALEISLDVQWAHAVAPGAKILLVEATTNSYANLFAAVDWAKANADYVSMSWGSSEFSGESTYDSHFSGTTSYFVSAGDNGTPAEYPSSSPKVLSIGGTKLSMNGTTLLSETGWTDGGGGCSAYEGKALAQTYPSGLCGAGVRATPDISLDADPASGVSVYDTTPYSGQTGWFIIGGTSASAPMLAARAAQTHVTVDAAYIYGNGGANVKVRDVTVGNNGAPCATGFDLCTGRGSWADSDSLATTTTSQPTTTTTAPTTTTTAAPTTTSTTVKPVATTVGASSITYTPSGRSLLINVHVQNDLGTAVSNASVTVQIYRNGASLGTSTGTTNISGNVTFKVSKLQSGTYTTAVRNIVANGLTWDTQTPTNSFVH